MGKSVAWWTPLETLENFSLLATTNITNPFWRVEKPSSRMRLTEQLSILNFCLSIRTFPKNKRNCPFFLPIPETWWLDAINCWHRITCCLRQSGRDGWRQEGGGDMFFAPTRVTSGDICARKHSRIRAGRVRDWSINHPRRGRVELRGAYSVFACSTWHPSDGWNDYDVDERRKSTGSPEAR